VNETTERWAPPAPKGEEEAWAGVVWGPKPSGREALIHAWCILAGPAPRNDAEARDRQVAAVLRALAAPELLAALESLVDELQAERPCPDVLRESLIPAALRAIQAAK
jgi:hypothetical protein